MTTGATGSFGAPSGGFTGFRSFHSRVGDDGKYESFNSGFRPKWNSLVSTRGALLALEATVGMQCPGYREDPPHVFSYATEFPFYNNLSDIHDFTDSEVGNMYAKLLDRVKGSSFNLGVNLSQTHQVVDMVSSNLGKLGRSFMALKHGDFATAARQLGAAPRVSKLKANDISGRWLELQYGWLPTLSDTYDAVKAFHALSNGADRTRFSVFKKQKSKQVFSSTTFNGDSWGLDVTVSKSIVYEASEELSFGRQLGLTDPLSIVWENIPYSFVVDWFVPIGTYLSNLNQIPHLLGRWMVTDLYETEKPVYHMRDNNLPFCDLHPSVRYTGVAYVPFSKYYHRYMVRSPSSAPPKVPTPSFKLIGAVHGNRVFNAISLAHQRFRF
jgi:hypothetical protein